MCVFLFLRRQTNGRLKTSCTRFARDAFVSCCIMERSASRRFHLIKADCLWFFFPGYLIHIYHITYNVKVWISHTTPKWVVIQFAKRTGKIGRSLPQRHTLSCITVHIPLPAPWNVLLCIHSVDVICFLFLLAAD